VALKSKTTSLKDTNTKYYNNYDNILAGLDWKQSSDGNFNNDL